MAGRPPACPCPSSRSAENSEGSKGGARQGDPGSAQAYVSVEDELLRRYLAAPVRRALLEAVKRELPGRNKLARTAFALAQRKAQSLAFQQRRAVLKTDLWLDEALSFTGGDVVG